MALSVGLSACGGGSSTKTATPEEMCTAAGGSYADGTCTTAAELLAQRQTEQRTAISDAIDAAEEAVAAVDDEATDEAVAAANAAVAAARTAISSAADVPQTEKDANTGTVDLIDGTLTAALTSRDAAMAEAARQAEMERLAAARQAEADAITAAIDAAKAAADALSAGSSPDDVAAANVLVAAADMLINDAEHASIEESRQSGAALDAVRAKISTADELIMARIEGEEAADERRTAQLNAIRTAAAMISTSAMMTADEITAARTAIAGLEAALAAATDVSDADKAMYRTQITAANTHISDSETANQLAADRDSQMMALSTARTALTTALSAISSPPTQAEIDAAQTALNVLNTAITDAADLTDAEKASAQLAAATAMGRIDGAKAALMAANEAAEEEQRKADEAARAAMQATALKLHTGIGSDPLVSSGDGTRTATSDADGVISVTIGTDAAVPLAEDKKTMVAALHGWEGKRHTAEPTGDVGTYEAMVYSNVGDPTEGDPFNDEYTLNADGETGDITALSGYVTGRVASPNFDQSAGAKLFDLPTNAIRVMVAGSYHGVAGTYYCTPTDANTKCSSTIAESGFTLAGGTWSFKPTTATAKVMSVADTVYASYGWWLHTAENGDLTASAFATSRGTVTAATGITALRGTATYMGGAAGKYALYSSTGGTNDAGHFTAKATLEADFNADMITGTIDEFMGADGMMRDWSVELKKSGVGDGGAITGSDGTGDPMETVWTIGGEAAAAAGQWSGTLYDNGDDGVPKVGTGTFHSEYSTSGRMVGAFGVNVE